MNATALRAKLECIDRNLRLLRRCRLELTIEAAFGAQINGLIDRLDWRIGIYEEASWHLRTLLFEMQDKSSNRVEELTRLWSASESLVVGCEQLAVAA